MSIAVVILDRLKLHATPAMGEGPLVRELSAGEQVEVFLTGDDDCPVILPVKAAGDFGYVSIAHISFV